MGDRSADAQLRDLFGPEALGLIMWFARARRSPKWTGSHKVCLPAKKRRLLWQQEACTTPIPKWPLQSCEPYLRSVFGFIGVTDVTFLTAGGTVALRQGRDRGEFLARHIATVQAQAGQRV